MRTLSSKKLKEAEKTLLVFDKEVSSIVFDVPSMLQYCLEKDLRDTLKQKRFKDREVDIIIRSSNFNILPRVVGINKVKFSVKRKTIVFI